MGGGIPIAHNVVEFDAGEEKHTAGDGEVIGEGDPGIVAVENGVAVFNAQRVLFFVATAAALFAGGGLAHVALVQLLPLALTLAWVLRDLRRRHPEIAVGLARSDARLALTFATPSSWFFLIRISQAAMIQGTTLVVRALLGPAAVTLFATLRTLCNLVRQTANALANALWPEITALDAFAAEHDTTRQRRGPFRIAGKPRAQVRGRQLDHVERTVLPRLERS